MAATLDQAAVDKRAKEIETEYLSSLADLNVNSKPLINMLTILAEENLDYAPIIVNAVEKHLAKVQSDVKLPILYLVDSIVKNVGKQYQALFSQVIVSMFCGVFESVTERIREKMFSLRQTWNEVFPQSKLYALDIKINSIDPGWPITAQLKSPKSPAIHVNPMFLQKQVAEPNLDMQQQLRDKQRELLELQARKLELELLATKKRIEEQEKQLVLQTASVSKEPVPDLKRAAAASGPSHSSTTTSAPAARGRIVPPNPAMLNLLKNRDPRLARQQAQLAAQMVAASTNSTPTLVGGVQVPYQPTAMDPSGKPLSIKERLGRIPKRVDPRLKAQGADIDRKKVSSTFGSATSTSQKSRSEYDPTKKRDKRDDMSIKSSKSSSMKPSGLDKKKASSDSSPPKSSSPMKKRSSSSLEKSPARSEKSASKMREGKPSKSSSKTANRRPRDSSKSPDNSSISPTSSSENLMPVANESKDVDLRLLIPEKKLRLEPQQQQQQTQPPLLPPLQQPKLISKPLAEQKKALGEAVDTENVPASKDIDLRIPPPVLLKDVVPETVVAVPSIGLPIVVPVTTITEAITSLETVIPAPAAPALVPSMPVVDTLKKRPSNHKYEEPSNKKSKTEKIDGLFGAEDVDLRKLTCPINPVEVSTPLPPPPPIISEAPRPTSVPAIVQNESLEKQNSAPSSKAALEAVRAKIAEATKNKDRDKLGRPLLYNKLPEDPEERRRSFNQPKPMDVDLRQQPLSQPPLQDTANDDNSQDGMNANIKTIIAQAQEQMDKGEITPDQFAILMKQVMQLNETQKIRQAQRMEMMKRNQVSTAIVPNTSAPVGPVVPADEATNSHSSDDVIVFSPTMNEEDEVRPNVPKVGPAPPVVPNDFRGKIAPMDTKSKFEASFANATAADLRQRDPRRQRDTRFSQPPWGIRAPLAAPNVIAPTGPIIINHRPPAPLLNPWEQPPFQVMDQGIGPRFPSIALNNGPPPTTLMPGVPKLNESVRTINIDGIQREIRFYDDIAVIFMSWDEPKEIGFQKGSRMVVVDDRDSFELSFNECHKAITIDNKVYQMKLGSPTRELYIDNSWYECYFGDPPSNIVLDGINRVFKISGPAPQVKIGNSRNDLVAGKINMIVNAEIIIPVFLDAQVQMFELNGQMHKLQFADFLLTVIINDQPFPVEYGGLPKVFKIRGKDYYIRFTAAPKLVVPGRVYIRDMVRSQLHRDLRTPPRDQSMLPPFVSSISNMMSSLSAPPSMQGLFPAAAAIQPPPQTHMAHLATGLDYLTNLMPHSSAAVNASHNLAGYQIQSEDKPILPIASAASANNSAGSLKLPMLQNINIDELYKKIVAAGILTKSNSAPASSSTTSSAAAAAAAASAASKLEKALEEELEEIEPVYLHKMDTIKRRQSAIVSQLFNGMQCSSCGVRFPPEQTMKYSQHLDWHFRQNRRDRDSARKAHSRKWYYDVSDWIQYEEIEDLEEREKNWFETQQAEQTEFNGDGDREGGRNVESPVPSCPAGSDETDKRCHMCHDEFAQFYNEETEEWHLKNSIRVDENTYHPLCYEDYKASLTLDETAMNATAGESDQSKIENEDVKVKQEAISDADDTIKEITLDDDDDVIVLPATEDIVTEIPDDDDIVTLDSHSTADDALAANGDDDNSKTALDSPMSEAISKAPQEPRIVETRIDDDITIQEPTIEKIDVNDLDESEDRDRRSGALDGSSQRSQSSVVKVKEEPKDDDDEDDEEDAFEDVGTIESSMVEVSKEIDTVDVEAVPSPPPPLESTSQLSIDGNVELQDAPAAGIITNRIKINITKAKTTANSSSATNNNNNNNNITNSTSSTATGNNSSSSSSAYSNIPSGGSSIAVLISGGGGGACGGYTENSNDDLLYGNMDDVHGHSENSQNSSSQLIMMHEEVVDDSNKGPVVVTEEEPTDIAYDLKPSLQGIDFTRQSRVENGFETSGLCSIM